MATVFETFKYEDILNLIPDHTNKSLKVPLAGFNVKIGNQRLVLLKKSNVCVCCGLVGTQWALEKTEPLAQTPHLNLYGIVGKERVLMTKDHIVPKSAGGDNTMDNLQTMCYICNCKKDDSTATLDEFRESLFNMNRGLKNILSVELTKALNSRH